MQSNADITFDEEHRIRVLAPEKFQQQETLEQECKQFTEKVDSFSSTVQTLVEVLDSQAKEIDEAKLR